MGKKQRSQAAQAAVLSSDRTSATLEVPILVPRTARPPSPTDERREDEPSSRSSSVCFSDLSVDPDDAHQDIEPVRKDSGDRSRPPSSLLAPPDAVAFVTSPKRLIGSPPKKQAPLPAAVLNRAPSPSKKAVSPIVTPIVANALVSLALSPVNLSAMPENTAPNAEKSVFHLAAPSQSSPRAPAPKPERRSSISPTRTQKSSVIPVPEIAPIALSQTVPQLLPQSLPQSPVLTATSTQSTSERSSVACLSIPKPTANISLVDAAPPVAVVADNFPSESDSPLPQVSQPSASTSNETSIVNTTVLPTKSVSIQSPPASPADSLQSNQNPVASQWLTVLDFVRRFARSSALGVVLFYLTRRYLRQFGLVPRWLRLLACIAASDLGLFVTGM